jgi:CBS domain-containing protein
MTISYRDVPLSSVHSRSPLRMLVVRPAIRVESDASLHDVSALMSETGITAVLVGARGTVLITVADIGRAPAAGCGPDHPAGKLDVREAAVVPGDMPVGEAAATMLNATVDHLVVDLGGGEYGIVTLPVVAAVLLQHVEGEIWLQAFKGGRG